MLATFTPPLRLAGEGATQPGAAGPGPAGDWRNERAAHRTNLGVSSSLSIPTAEDAEPRRVVRPGGPQSASQS